MDINERTKSFIKTREFHISKNDDIKEIPEENLTIEMKNSYGEVEKIYKIADIDSRIKRMEMEVISIQSSINADKEMKDKLLSVIKSEKFKHKQLT